MLRNCHRPRAGSLRSASARRGRPWRHFSTNYRDAVTRKVSGVSEADARRQLVSSATAAVQMREVDPAAPLPAGQAVVVIGREFLIPDPAQWER